MIGALVYQSIGHADFCDEAQLVYKAPGTSQQACGVDSLYVCLRTLGVADVDLLTLENELQVGPKGVSFAALATACEKRSVKATAVRLNPNDLRDFGQPMILHVGGIHYVSLLCVHGDELFVFDNQVGLIRCTKNWFSKSYKWDGTALIIGFPSPSTALALYGGWISIALGLVAGMLLIARIALFRKR